MVSSPWEVQPYLIPQSSFNEPVAIPATGPDVGPFICAHIPVAWLALVAGALSQLRMPVTWEWSTSTQLNQVMHWVDALIGSIALADICPQLAVVSVSIAPGSATGTASVVFALPFAATPTVLVSTSDGTVIPSWESVTSSGFVARITSNVLLPSGLTVNVSYQASV